MGRLGYVPSLLCAEFVMGRVCHVPSLLCDELSLNLLGYCEKAGVGERGAGGEGGEVPNAG